MHILQTFKISAAGVPDKGMGEPTCTRTSTPKNKEHENPELYILYVPINEKDNNRPLNASVKSDVARSSTTATSNSAPRLANTERRYPALANRTVL